MIDLFLNSDIQTKDFFIKAGKTVNDKLKELKVLNVVVFCFGQSEFLEAFKDQLNPNLNIRLFEDLSETIPELNSAFVIFPSSKLSNQELLKTYEFINKEEEPYVISLQNPFSINPKNGKSVFEKVIVSDLLITYEGLPIQGVLQDGITSYKSRVIIDSKKKSKPFGKLIQKEDFYKKVFVSERNVNKGSNGKTVCIGGSKDYPGAVYITHLGSTSYVLGSGYSYISFPKSMQMSYILQNPQLLIKPYTDNEGHYVFDSEFLDSLMDFTSICIGNGMGVSEEVYKGVSYLLKHYKGLLIIDADGLNSISKYGLDVLSKHSPQVILTPHLKEFSRLTKTHLEDAYNNLLLPKEFASKYKVTLLLKSSSSLITDGREVFINTSGNQGLAKAGSGDILAGIILGLGRLENLSTIQKACLGSYLLGRASEIYSLTNAPFTMSYEDIIVGLKAAIKELI